MSGTNRAPRAVVIGVGNSWAGDDAAGVLVARALQDEQLEEAEVVVHEGEPTALLDLWDDAALAIVVDAIEGAEPPGTVRCFEAADAPLPSSFAGRSTHALTVAEAIELARRLGRLPGRLVVVGIEGRNFGAGQAPGPAVSAAVEPAAAQILALLRGDY